jgi:hypothetical protein
MTKASDGCVFIACDWQDLREAEQVTGALEQKGLSVWAGPRDAGTSDPAAYAAAARHAATRCSAFVLLLSGRQVDLAALSELCRTAEAAARPIYPVRVTEQAFVPDFPALQRAKSWIDATGAKRDAELARLAAELQPLAAPAPSPAVPSWQAAPAAPSPASPNWQAPASASPNWQAPAPASPNWQAPAEPRQAPQAWGTGGRRAGQPLWMTIKFIVVGIVLILSGLARMFRALG